MYNRSINSNSFNSPVNSNLTQPAAPVPNNSFGQSYVGSYSTNMPVSSAVPSHQQANASRYPAEAMSSHSYDIYPAGNSRSQLVRVDRVNQSTPLPAGVVSEVNDDDFREKVLNSATPVIVKFEAPWCGPCKAMSPLLRQLAIDNVEQLRFAHMNVDSSPETADTFDVQTLPTMILFENGKEVRRTQGAQTPTSLAAFINNYSAV